MQLIPVLAKVIRPFEYKKDGMAFGIISIPRTIIKKGEDPLSFLYITVFGEIAELLSKLVKGNVFFIKNWHIEQRRINEKYYYDFIIKEVELIESGRKN